MSIRLEMLGPARVALGNGTFRPLKATLRDQALALLAITGDWVTRDRLGFLFWADSPDSTARHNVRQLLKRIRRLEWLEGFEADDSAVKWSVRTDVADLRTAIARHVWDALPQSGDLLPGMERNSTVEFEEWLLDQRRQIRAEWQLAVVAAARSAAARGDKDIGLDLLEPLLAGDDGEKVLHVYMELATKAGHRSLAIAGFERVATRLRNELDVDPPEKARHMAQRLASHTDSEPADLGSSGLVGRGSELVEIDGILMLPECRLLTLFGPGGIGKSSIAQMVLSQAKGRYVDGGSLVSLEAVGVPDDVLASIASELGISLDARVDPIDRLSAVLRGRHMLLVLDNAEHLRPAWVQFSRLLDSCPGLVMVITSRERLRLEDEWVYEVEGLPEEDGVELFLEVGRRVAPNVTVSAEDARAICRAVGGSPLGIELAAPWLRVMPIDEIVSEIQHDQQILSGGRRDGLARHESITATMKHSWDLATADERQVAEALSVFAAPYTRELAAHVGNATANLLRDLLDKSLVHARPNDRYSSHPLVRGYAASRLEEDDQRHQDVRRRHAVVILQLVESLTDSPTDATLIEDAVVAWQYAVESRSTDLIVPAVEGFTTLVVAAGRINRGLQLLVDASALLDETTPEGSPGRAATKHAESRLLYLQGRHYEAALAAETALLAAIELQDPRMRIKAAISLGWARKWTAGDHAQYETIFEALPAAEELGDGALIAEVLNGLGCSASTLEKCRDHLQDGLGRADAPRMLARLSYNLGMVLWALGDGRIGIEHLQKALDIARSVDDHNRTVDSLTTLAFVHAQLGDHSTALRLSGEAESLTGTSEIVDTRIYVRLVAGEVHRLTGDTDGARTRLHDCLTVAAAVDNEPFTLRALRLHAQLLLDQGDVDQGLGILAFVLTRTATKGGDFTSEITNPKAWEEATRDTNQQRVDEARAWATDRNLDDVIANALSWTERPDPG